MFELSIMKSSFDLSIRFRILHYTCAVKRVNQLYPQRTKSTKDQVSRPKQTINSKAQVFLV